MTTCIETLTTFAKRFDEIANFSQGRTRRRALKDAAHMRFVRDLINTGSMTTDDGWVWCDAAAGQLIRDRQQLARKALNR